LPAQIYIALAGRGFLPVLLAQGLHGGQYILEYLQFALGETGARPGFTQGDIDETLVADGEQVAALILVAAVAVPGPVVLTVLETGGGQVTQAEHTEFPVAASVELPPSSGISKYSMTGRSVAGYNRMVVSWQGTSSRSMSTSIPGKSAVPTAGIRIDRCLLYCDRVGIAGSADYLCRIIT
jgi:hypothetical protein